MALEIATVVTGLVNVMATLCVIIIRVALKVTVSMAYGLGTVAQIGFNTLVRVVIPTVAPMLPGIFASIGSALWHVCYAVGYVGWGILGAIPGALAGVIRALAVVAGYGISASKDLLWAGMLWLKQISPDLFYFVFDCAKWLGTSLSKLAIHAVYGVQAAITTAVIGLRDPATPDTAAIWEPVLQLGLSIMFFLLVVALSDYAGRRLFMLRPMFVVPATMGTIMIAMTYDDVKSNNQYIEIAGGLNVLWMVLGFGVYLFEGRANRHLAAFAAYQQRTRERTVRDAARAAIERQAQSQRDRSVAAAAATPVDEDEEDDECPVCLVAYTEAACREEFEETWQVDGERSVLICNHVLHAACARKWFARSATCPVCRQPISHAGRLVHRLFSVR